ncbi:hypothetical protein DEO72_LG5g1558 [Vigna unguiculata]|uniref:Uncharacterized protein n=1 Tax=Vigna unguiculata TaxID=3917 RepID=A0A4D6LYB3_VIGUN|nr:hypothetical protein DEO72_LG5g1558 [Vigna unguiculata]
MLALVVDTSAHPRAAHPRAMCHKCYDGSIFPHHKTAPSPSPSLKQTSLARARETLAQARPHRLGESSKSWNSGLCTVSLRRDPPRLGEMLAQINRAGRLGDPSRENSWASLSSSCLSETARLGEIINPRPLLMRVTDEKHI